MIEDEDTSVSFTVCQLQSGVPKNGLTLKYSIMRIFYSMCAIFFEDLSMSLKTFFSRFSILKYPNFERSSLLPSSSPLLLPLSLLSLLLSSSYQLSPSLLLLSLMSLYFQLHRSSINADVGRSVCWSDVIMHFISL